MYMPVLLVSLSLVSQAVVEAAGSSFCFYQLRKSYEALRSRCYNRQAHEKSAPFWGPFRPSSPDPSAKTVKHQEQEHKRWPNLGGVTCTGLLINRLVHQRAISPRTADKQDGKTNEHVLAGCERGRVRSRLLRGMDRYCSLYVGVGIAGCARFESCLLPNLGDRGRPILERPLAVRFLGSAVIKTNGCPHPRGVEEDRRRIHGKPMMY